MEKTVKGRKHKLKLILAAAMDRTVEEAVSMQLDAKEDEIVERVLERLTQMQVRQEPFLPGCVVNQGGGI